jgi:Na+-transporting NADH:ubiquinone oxidoreductase subunit C
MSLKQICAGGYVVHKNSYVFFFAAVVTISCSILLAAAANLLRDRQQENIALDIRKNILASAELGSEEMTRQEVLSLYDKYIRSKVINLEGEEVPDKTVEQLNPKKDLDLLPLYYAESDGEILAYIIPISGKGLWSTIYGYLALEQDLNTVKGITFYQHGETPGLGGEIEKEWFTGNFKGKKIHSPEGNLVSITVIKGKVQDLISESEAYRYVDGISGSTLTGNGLNNFLKKDLETYKSFIDNIRLETMEK